MAEFTATAEEIAADSYLEWDDASLGKMVKATALLIGDARGEDSIKQQSAGLLLAGMMDDTNAETLTIEMKGVTGPGGRKIGDVTIKATLKKPR